MISEFAIAGGFVYTYNRFKDRDLYKIKKIIKDILENNNLDYGIVSIERIEYGCKLIVSLYAVGFEKLEKSKDLLESSLGYTVDIQQNKNLKTATIYVITDKLTDNYPFRPIKVKPWELYLGKTYTMKDVIVSMEELPHVLYSGINSSGKTYCVITALVNLIHNCTEREIEIFLAQISAKKDLRKFKDISMCRGYAPTLQEAFEMFNYLYHTMLKRINIFNSVKDKFIDDIYEWNKAFPKRKMRVVYLAMDEFTAYMPDSLDNKEDAELKGKCLDLLVKLIQQCRCAGIYILTSLQRPDKESLPPRLKAQFNCKVSFKQPNIASSLVVTDSDKAYYLKPKREAIVNADDEYLMKTLYLDNDMVANFIKDKIDITHKNYYNYKELSQIEEDHIPQTDKRTKTKSKVKVKKNVPNK